MTRQTAAINVGPGHDRPERARACLLTGEVAAAAAHDAHDRPRLGETSRRAIESADRPHAPSADSGPAGSPDTADAREPAGTALWLALCQAPDDGADVTGLMRVTGRPGTRLDRHRRQPAGAEPRDRGQRRPLAHAQAPGAVLVSDRPGGRRVPSGRESARDARTPAAGQTDQTGTHGGTARQPLSDQERAAIRQAGADDARRSRAEHGFPERIEDPAAVAVLTALLRDARPPPRIDRTPHTSTPAA